MIRSDFIYYADTLDCFIPFFFFPLTEAHVRYNLVSISLYDTDLTNVSCTILSGVCLVYNINLRATTTMILSIRGVMIPIDLVSSATDSIRQCVVLFKPVTVRTSDPKSEFLCQSSLCCAEPADPPNHLVHLGYLPCLCQHISPLLPQSQCSYRVPQG